jgi:hypothetical protein
MPIPTSRNARLFYRAAKQRFDDALLLIEFKRTTAAVYLAGYSVECMLKALILSIVPRNRENEILNQFRGVQAHDYDWLIRLYRRNGGAQIPVGLIPNFTRVNTWSTHIRYSPETLEGRRAKAFVDAANEINQWADGRL